GADGDTLPEGLDADDDEPGLQHGRDEQAHDGAEDGALATEDGRSADHHRGDDVEVGQGLARDGRGAELRQRQHRPESGHQPGDRVDDDQVSVDLDPDPAGAQLVRADGVGVATELGPVQDDPADDHRDERDERECRDAEDLGVGVEVGERLGHGADVHAAGDDLGQAEGDRQRAERDDQRRNLGLRDQEAVEGAPRHADDEGDEEADEGGPPSVAAYGFHHLRRHDGGEHEHGADREVDAGGD